MKLNKNQLEVLFEAVTCSKTGQTFWNMVLGMGHDFGYALKSEQHFKQKWVDADTKDRKVLVAALRQLADAIEANPPTLHPKSDETPKVKAKK